MPIFRRGQGPEEERDDVHIDFPALEEAGLRSVQSARLSVWNVWWMRRVHLKCMCDKVKIVVAVQIGVSVLTELGLGFYVHWQDLQTSQPGVPTICQRGAWETV